MHSVTKIDGQWSVVEDGKTVFTGPRSECQQWRPEKEKADKPEPKEPAKEPAKKPAKKAAAKKKG